MSSSATTPPAGITAIPLARVDVPAGTSNITQAMITDLRYLLNARRDRYLAAVTLGAGPGEALHVEQALPHVGVNRQRWRLGRGVEHRHDRPAIGPVCVLRAGV